MDVVINIEPDQEEEMCNKQKPQKKRSCSIWFWLCLIIVPVAIGGGLTAFFLIPRGPDPTPKLPTTSPETPSSTTPRPTEETTIPTAVIPTTDDTTITDEITTYDQNSFVKDVPITISNESWFVHLFRGEIGYESMRLFCDNVARIHESKESTTKDVGVSKALKEMRGAVYFNNKEEEKRFDTIILDNTNNSIDSVFGTLPHTKRLLWTGCAYEYKISGNWETECEKDKLKAYNNFCNDDWEQEMEELKKGKEVFYIVKDYTGESKHFCWRFYDIEKLKEIMGDDYTNPYLPFACNSPNHFGKNDVS